MQKLVPIRRTRSQGARRLKIEFRAARLRCPSHLTQAPASWAQFGKRRGGFHVSSSNDRFGCGGSTRPPKLHRTGRRDGLRLRKCAQTEDGTHLSSVTSPLSGDGGASDSGGSDAAGTFVRIGTVTVPTGGNLSVAVYDPTGQIVRTLMEAVPTGTGSVGINWDGKDD